MTTNPNLDALNISNLTVHYPGQDTPALESINVSAQLGKIYAIIGPNGAGKSTFIKAILGLTPVQSGEITCLGQSVHQQKRKIAYIPQRSTIDWNFPISVREVVQLGLFPDLKRFEFFTPKRHKHITDMALAQLGITELADRQISKLSGGQQQRMFIARALAQSMMENGADIFLMDEPFTGIDAATEKDLIDILKLLARQEKCVLAVHHNLSSVSDIFTDIIFLNRSIIAQGKTADIYTDDYIKRTFIPSFTNRLQVRAR